MIQSYIRRNGRGEMVWTVKVTGAHNMWRVAYHLARAQCDILPHGRRVFAYLHRTLGRERFDYMDKALENGAVRRHGWHRRVRGGL